MIQDGVQSALHELVPLVQLGAGGRGVCRLEDHGAQAPGLVQAGVSALDVRIVFAT